MYSVHLREALFHVQPSATATLVAMVFHFHSVKLIGHGAHKPSRCTQKAWRAHTHAKQHTQSTSHRPRHIARNWHNVHARRVCFGLSSHVSERCAVTQHNTTRSILLYVGRARCARSSPGARCVRVRAQAKRVCCVRCAAAAHRCFGARLCRHSHWSRRRLSTATVFSSLRARVLFSPCVNAPAIPIVFSSRMIDAKVCSEFAVCDLRFVVFFCRVSGCV